MLPLLQSAAAFCHYAPARFVAVSALEPGRWCRCRVPLPNVCGSVVLKGLGAGAAAGCGCRCQCQIYTAMFPLELGCRCRCRVTLPDPIYVE